MPLSMAVSTASCWSGVRSTNAAMWVRRANASVDSSPSMNAGFLARQIIAERAIDVLRHAAFRRAGAKLVLGNQAIDKRGQKSKLRHRRERMVAVRASWAVAVSAATGTSAALAITARREISSGGISDGTGRCKRRWPGCARRAPFANRRGRPSLARSSFESSA